MALKMAMWVQGTAVEVENPDALVPNGIFRDLVDPDPNVKFEFLIAAAGADFA